MSVILDDDKVDTIVELMDSIRDSVSAGNIVKFGYEFAILDGLLRAYGVDLDEVIVKRTVN